MSEISVLILTYNSIRFIQPCLDSVFSQDYQDLEVIIVDNGSNDGTVNFIKENYLLHCDRNFCHSVVRGCGGDRPPRLGGAQRAKASAEGGLAPLAEVRSDIRSIIKYLCHGALQVRLIENRENLGACKARNQGIEVAQGRWILTLDCDVILEKDFLKNIIDFAEKSEESIGSFQPKIIKDNKKTIYSCGIYLSKLRRFYDIGKRKPDNGDFDKAGYVFGACSAAALYKRQMLDEIKEKAGYFDERFFFLVEDVDLAWRAQKKYWKALYIPAAICYHSGNSSDSNSRFRRYLCFRNRYLMILKNDRLAQVLKNVPFMLTYDLARLLYLVLINRGALRALREIANLKGNDSVLKNG